MVQMVKRWKVTAEFQGPRQAVTIFINENFLGDVVERVRHIEFATFPEPQPAKLTIEAEPEKSTQTGIFQQ